MITLKLNRFKYTEKQTLGYLKVFKDDNLILKLCTLEKPWKSNEINKSCIPFGLYNVEPYSSKKHPNTFILKKTEPRSYILIHSGNRYQHTAGCILVGTQHKDLNSDGFLDCINSNLAMELLRVALENETIILKIN